MKKTLLSVALILTILVAFAIPAFSAGNLYSRANEWYYNSDSAGILKVADNKVTYTYNNIVVGDNFLGLQKGFTGQLRFVSFEHVCEWVEITVPPTCSLQGYTTNVCKDGCGNVWGYWWDYTDALGHDFQSSKYDGHGWWYYDCSRCDWQGYGPCQHDFVWGNYTEPTCVADGFDTLLCKYCGELGGFWNYDHGSAFGHDFASLVWDGWGWLASDCSRCDWQGYISYEYCDYCGGCDECNPPVAPDPYTVTGAGNNRVITINEAGYYNIVELFGSAGSNRAWANVSSLQGNNREVVYGNTSVYFVAGAVIYNARNQNEQ